MNVLRAVVSGRVQGVGFRAFVRGEARALGLTGWVRNTDEGAVELEAEGPGPALDALLAALRRGPPASRVAGVDARREERARSDPEGPAFTTFEIRR